MPSFEQSIILLLLGAILGSGGSILAGKSVLKRRGVDSEELEALLRELRDRKADRKELEDENA